MDTPNGSEPLKIGTAVKIRDSGYGRARIAEFRGALGPNGARVYSVRVRKRPRPAYVEVLEEQLEVLHCRKEEGEQADRQDEEREVIG